MRNTAEPNTVLQPNPKNKTAEKTLLQYKIKYLTASILKYFTLVLAAAVAIVPILVILFTSLKTNQDYQTSGPLSLPTHITFSNYVTAFTEGGMLNGFKNTFIILIVTLAGRILFGTAIAYVLHRFKFGGKKVILGAFIAATFVPAVINNIVVFKIISALHLYNKLGSVVLLGVGTDVISMYIFLQFLDRIPVSLDESAMLDGASYFTIYRRIILPLLKPAIVTVCILNGVGIYNDFYTPFLYMPKTELRTISTALYSFKGPMGSQWQIIAAGVMIVIIPTLIIFLLLQRHIYNGVQGSVK